MKKEIYKLILVAIMIVFAFSLGFFLGREVTLAQPKSKPQQAHNNSPHSTQSPTPKKPLKNPRVGSDSFARPGASKSPQPKSQREKVKEYKKNWLNKDGQTVASPSPNAPLEQKNALSPNPVITRPVLKENPDPAQKPQLESHTPEIQGSLPPDPKLKSKKQGADPAISVSALNPPPPLAQVGDKSPPKADSEVQNEQSAPTSEQEPPTNKLYALHIKSHQNQLQAKRQSTDLKLKFPTWRFFFQQTGKTYTVYIGPFKRKQSAQRALRRLKNKKEFASTRIEEIE